MVDFVLERKREKREALVGARLAQVDLASAAFFLKDAEQTGQWWIHFKLPMHGWEAHRADGVVEDEDPENPPLPQQANPEAETIAQFRADMPNALNKLQGS